MHQLIRPLVWSIAIVMLGCAAAWYTAFGLNNYQHGLRQERFDAWVRQASELLVQRFQLYEYGLRGARGAIISAGIDSISRATFRNYAESRDLAREFPGSRGFGFIRRVTTLDEPGFLRAMRADGMPGFQVKELSAHSDDHLIIQFIEPQATNQAAIGLDIASGPVRRQAALSALSEDQPTLTEPITLVQAKGKTDQGFLFFLPIYRPGMALNTPAERLHAAAGLVYTPLVIDEVLKSLNLFQGALTLALYDARHPDALNRFYTSELTERKAAEGLAKRVPLAVYGTRWVAEFKATPAFVTEMNLISPRLVALAILAIFFVAACLNYFLSRYLQQKKTTALDNARIAAIVDSAGEGIIGTDLHGAVTSWNRAAEEILGYSAEEAVNQLVADLIVPDGRKHEDREILACIQRGERTLPLETVRRHRDGNLIDVLVTVTPVFDAKRNPIGAAKTIHNISEQKAAHARILELNATLEAQVQERTAKLAANERFLKSVIDAVPGLIGYWDTDLRCHFANLAYQEWFGRSAQEMIGISSQDLLGEELFREIEPFIRKALQGEPQYMERIFIKPDGTAAHTVAHYLPDFDDGLVRGYIVVATDVTSIKQVEEALLQAKRKAEEATQAKSEFLANMSHEIRTPMNAILGLCYVLEKQQLTPATHEMVRKIQHAGRSLLGLINDILDFSKIEAQRLEIESIPFRLSDVLDNLASIMASSLGSKTLELAVSSVPAEADFLCGDALRLEQVLINLAGNAIKFTEEGEVTVLVERLGDDPAGRLLLRFNVRDTGIGIPKEKQELIFDAFSQADSTTTRNFGGTGLGLAISARLIALMGGQIQVISEPGQGSEFSFVLPFERSDAVGNAMPDMTHLRVLVADDHVTARTVLVDAVRSLGWCADSVESGEQAVAQVSNPSVPEYDVLLLDWRMPGVDGLQAAIQIQQVQGLPRIPVIVMVTAYDRDLLMAQVGSQVVDVALNKPVTSSSLYNAVMQAKQSRGELREVSPDLNELSRLQGLRLLVVDDSDINRDVAERILSGEGAIVELAEDGAAALALLRDSPKAFDVVLMDMQMPVMDGYTATRHIRATPALAHLPVIALTAGAFKSQRDHALDVGVDDFVAKPFEVDQLIEAILRASLRPADPYPGYCATIRQEKNEAQGRPSNSRPKVLDIERGLKVWGTPAEFGHYLRKFVASHGDACEQINGTEPELAARLVHKLKGAAAQLGLDGLAEAASKVEHCLKLDEQADGAMRELQHAMAEARAAIEDYAKPLHDATSQPAAKRAVDPRGLTDALTHLLYALDSDDAIRAEQALGALAALLPDENYRQLQSAIANYDYREAEAAVRQIAEIHKLTLGE